jgi:hypothetical protein
MGNLTTFSLGNDDIQQELGGVAAPGDYHLSVVSAEVKTSKSGNQYVSVQFRIEDDQPFANLRIFEIYSLEGNEKAVKIGRSAMAKLGKLNGVDNVTDTQQLIGAHVYGTVVIEKNEGYSDRNRLRKFEDLRGRKNLVSKGSSDQALDATFG